VTHWPETEVQDVDPGVEYDPGAQALHEEAPVLEEKVFREQFEQVEDPVVEEKRPAAHEVQLNDPVLEVKLPAAHNEHELEPDTFE